MKTNNSNSAKSCKELYEAFDRSQVKGAKICTFEGVDGYDVYNPSVPFTLGGKRYIAGRVEKRRDVRSHVRCFEEKNGVFHAVPSKILNLQDPFVSIINNEVILGGVQVEYFTDYCIWTTEFYRMKSLEDIELITRGPKLMKDIRLVQLKNGKIGVFTRPQGQKMLDEYGCVAKIGFTVADSLADLNPEMMESAPFIEDIFKPDEWGGCNHAMLLENGELGVVGHIASRTYEGKEQRLHYYGMAFRFNPETLKASPVKMIISRDCFPAAEGKRPDLTDVTFTAGIVPDCGGKATVWSGLGDVNVGCAEIPDPFA